MKISTSSTADDISIMPTVPNRIEAVVFARADALHFEIFERSQRDHQRDQQHNKMEEDAEGIDADAVVEGAAVVVRLE